MKLTTAQHDRAAGVLLAMAAGATRLVCPMSLLPLLPGVEAALTGGGLGNFAPGEWSDDTSMAIAIARVTATGADLTTAGALDDIAEGFLEWHQATRRCGIQTSSVLRATRTRLTTEAESAGRVMTRRRPATPRRGCTPPATAL